MEDGTGMMFSGWLLTGYSYNVSVEELFDLFGKFGPIRYVQEGLKERSILTIQPNPPGNCQQH
jgi:RNA recognition motif-containing protein